MALLNKCIHFSLIPCFLYVYPSWTSYFFLWGQENFNVPQQCSSYSFWNNQWPLSCPESHGPVVYPFPESVVRLFNYWEAFLFLLCQTPVPQQSQLWWPRVFHPLKGSSASRKASQQPRPSASCLCTVWLSHCWARSFPMWRQIPQRQTSFLIPIPSKKECTGLLLTLLSSLTTFEEKKSST